MLTSFYKNIMLYFKILFSKYCAKKVVMWTNKRFCPTPHRICSLHFFAVTTHHQTHKWPNIFKSDQAPAINLALLWNHFHIVFERDLIQAQNLLIIMSHSHAKLIVGNSADSYMSDHWVLTRKKYFLNFLKHF